MKPLKCRTCQKLFKSYNKNPKFCSGSCSAKARGGRKHPRWRCGKTIKNGYVAVWIGATATTKLRYAYEHRIKMEKFLDRKLKVTEIVHHKNGNKTDNRLSNLELVSRSNHASMHSKERKLKYFGKNAHLLVGA